MHAYAYTLTLYHTLAHTSVWLRAEHWAYWRPQLVVDEKMATSPSPRHSTIRRYYTSTAELYHLFLIFVVYRLVIIIITSIIKNEFDLGGTIALLLQDYHTMLPWSVSRLFHNVYNSMTQEKWLRKQERFKFQPERDDGWSSPDLRRQRVPSPSCSHRKSAIADHCVTRR